MCVATNWVLGAMGSKGGKHKLYGVNVLKGPGPCV